MRKERGTPSNPLLKKIGVKAGMRISLLNPPAEASAALHGLPDSPSPRLTGYFDYIHFFARSEKEFRALFPRAKKHLKPGGMLWASWPKHGQSETDLNMKTVIRLGYAFGLVESKCIGVDSTWSALKFTFPKRGKEYKNSYGRLKTSKAESRV